MIYSIALIIIAAFAKAVMDRSSEGALPGDYWNKNKSWINKWKHGDRNLGEAFPGSSTVFVALTDGWHLAQMVFLAAMFGLIVTYSIHFSMVIDYLILRVLFGVTFEAFYRLLKG